MHPNNPVLLLRPQPNIVVAAAYVGPVDVNGAAYCWYGLRGASAAFATPGTGKAIKVVDQAGNNPLDVVILTNGNLDVASINTWVTANTVTTIKVTTLYDQSGGNAHLTQATLALMPVLVLSSVPGLGASKPALLFASASSQLLSGSVTSSLLAQPFTMSGVAQATSTATMFYLGSNSTVGCGFNINVANDVGFFATTVLTQTTKPVNNFYACQFLANGVSSSTYINGSSSSGDDSPTTGFATANITVGKDAFNRYMNGYVTETGVWASDQSANNSTINSQQRAYWGF